ncbi:MAG: MtrB/PioB family outer membrane beta-barrel protein [Gammaproteobacteria bacterium]
MIGIAVGARVEWNAIKDLLDVNLEYIFSRAVTDFDIAGGSNRTFEPLPDLVSQIHSLGINGRYHLDDQTAINFGYRFQTLSTDDFALDGVGVDTIDQVLGLGESSPNYVAHVFGVSLSYRF